MLEKERCINFRNQTTLCLSALINDLQNFERYCNRNGIDTAKIPVVISQKRLLYGIPWFGISLGLGGKGTRITLEAWDNNALPILEDKRPEARNAEYWKSRGPSSFDVSGFVHTKASGERLLRMVKYILEKDDIETWLDWRETEPDWIQFKFSAKEFDVRRLSEMTLANNDIITESIIRECVLNTNKNP